VSRLLRPRPCLPMKSLAFILAAILVVACRSLAASTPPFGYVTVTVPAGSAVSPSYTPLAIPLYTHPVFSGKVTSADSATQLTLSGAVWTAGQHATTAAPRFARITAGSGVGRCFLITANTTSQLTLSLAHTPTITDVRTVVSAGDSVSIIPANTLGSVFGTTTPLLVAGASASAADNVYLLNGPGLGWSTYYHNGTNWRRAGSLANQNNTILYPDEGMLVVHLGTSPVTLMLSGRVPVTTEKSDISASGSTFGAQRFPVDMQLLAVGYHLLPGWIPGATVSTADNVWAWSTSLKKWEQFYYNGTNWRKAGSIANQNTKVLSAGSAVIVIRTGTSTAATLSQSLPYVP
jgi:uncharacterized protein (TIGR02597 family)